MKQTIAQFLDSRIEEKKEEPAIETEEQKKKKLKAKEYRLKHRAKIKEYNRRYYKENKERINARRRQRRRL